MTFMPPMPPSTRLGPMRLGFVCPHNPHDRRAFSGTAYFAAQALARHPDVTLHILGNHRPPHWLDPLLRRQAPRFDPQSLDFRGLDALVGLVASSLIDQIDRAPDLPFVHVSDATPDFLRTCYGRAFPPDADRRERRITHRAATCVYSSREIAKRAAAEFAVTPEAIPFGVNLATRPPATPKPPPQDRLDLIFVCTDWQRKGGEIALATLDHLRAAGVAAHLTAVGRIPGAHRRHPGLTATGYLNKNRRRHRARLSRLYDRAHLMILPTQADCTPMVIPEAMAHGLPVLASDLGGIGTLLGQGCGRMLPRDAPPADWARALCEMTASAEIYQMLSDAARDRALNYLTWDNWSERLVQVLQKTLARTDRGPQAKPATAVA